MASDSAHPPRSLWTLGWASMLALAWLLPNHQAPWSSFHMDAWAAVVLALACVVVLVHAPKRMAWHGLTLLIAALTLLPALHYGLGLVFWSGSAWVSGTYLLGLLMALLTGAEWERASAGQWADGLFLAIGMACLLSVGLQLDQWLNLDVWGGWSMGPGYGRPFANFGQPNQLATLLLWGLLATAWGMLQRHISLCTASLLMLYLLFGLALTQSRTAWLALGVLLLASWVWRRLWPHRHWTLFACGWALYFAACVAGLEWLNQVLLLDTPALAGNPNRIVGELRPAIWTLFVDAALQSPWTGYGWNELGSAQLAAALNHPSLAQPHAHSHNLFLDLVLWCGIPLGLALSLYLLRWIWLRVCAVSDAQQAVLVLFLLVIGVHAMLELPLHYAYFLLPTGLVMGALNVRLQLRPVLCAPRWMTVGLCALSILLLSLLVRDYLSVQASHLALRLEQARIKSATPWEAPPVLLLTQFRELFRFTALTPGRDMQAEDLDWMRKVSQTYPSAATLPKLALALALNGQGVEARTWLRKVCKIESELRCAGVRQYWADQSVEHPELASVPWPVP